MLCRMLTRFQVLSKNWILGDGQSDKHNENTSKQFKCYRGSVQGMLL